MHFSSFAAIAALATLAIAAPANLQRHTLHQRRAPSENWIKRGAVHPDVKLPMRIGLFGQNMDKGHEMLMDVSDPESKNFGKFYTAEEVHDLFAPAESSAQAVRSWLEKAGVHADRISQSVNKQWYVAHVCMLKFNGQWHTQDPTRLEHLGGREPSPNQVPLLRARTHWKDNNRL